ncbi:MAG: ABC transporter ATP-binding protein, partial [Chloroflexi bacterium]|nr:ABC transporter ATP-binding protein [Chloroflexota bacterium]
DAPLRAEMLGLLGALRGETAVLFVSHDRRSVSALADRVVALSRGRLVQ